LSDDYRKLSVRAKRRLAILRVQESPVRCPQCDAALLPCELLVHQTERCEGELPPPSPAARWLTRVEALQVMLGSRLDRLIDLGLVRRASDGRVLQRDVVLAASWLRAMELL
jgi:hypothetical protein